MESGGCQGFLSEYYPTNGRCGDCDKNPKGLTLKDGKRNGYFCIFIFFSGINYTQNLHFMENPFDIIVQRLDSIEKLLNELSKNANNSKPPKDTDEIMTVEQLSDYLTIARQTIYEKCSKKEIPYFKAGKRLYFKKSVINDWINSGRRYTTDELMQQAAEWARKHPRKL